MMNMAIESTNLLVILGIAFVMRCLRSLPLFWVVVWPGTAVHEFLHWIVGKILGARPVHLTLLPKHTEDEMVLGSVSFANVTWWNGLPIGLAPLLAIPVCVFLSANLHIPFNWKGGLMIWVLSSSLSMCSPSVKDRSIAFVSIWGITLWGSVFYLIARENQDLHPLVLSLESELVHLVKLMSNWTREAFFYLSDVKKFSS